MHTTYRAALAALLLSFALFVGTSSVQAAVVDEGQVGSTIQYFEEGFMIWRADTGTIYAFANDGRFWEFPAVTYGNLPQRGIFGIAPGRYLYPTNGFYRVWSNFPRVRAALGWAARPEVGLLIPITRDTERNRLYLQFSTILSYQLNANGSWQRIDTAQVPRPTPSTPHLPAPTIAAFSVTPQQANWGDTLTITYDVRHVDYVTVRVEAIILYGSSRASVVTLQDWPVQSATGTLTYTLPARDDALYLRVTVDGVARDVGVLTSDFVDINVTPPDEAPLQSRRYVAYQAYENGFMVWDSVTEIVYHFLNTGNNGAVINKYAYETHADPPQTYGVPAGRIEPINAFSRVFNMMGAENAAIGWPVAPEQGYEARLTLLRNGQIDTITLPDGRSIDLSDDRRYANFTWQTTQSG